MGCKNSKNNKDCGTARPQPMTPKAGVTKTKRKFCNGGKLKK